MKKFMRKSCLGFVLAAVLIAGSGIPAKAQGKQIGTIAGHAVYDNQYENIDLQGVPQGSQLANYGAGLPSKYDPRPAGKVTAIEDQGNTMNCWAFASIAAIEGNLLKKGYATKSLNLSENHLAYFFYNMQADKLGNTSGDKNIAVGATWDQRGGNLELAGLHLQTWSGVVNEPSYEDVNGIYTPNARYSASDCFKSNYRVTNTHFIYPDIVSIKQAITDYGAVACGIYTPTTLYDQTRYWNFDNGACYVDSATTGNHAVTIVGWDDNYPKENFNVTPKNNGAWIIKNSYGNIFAGDGYMYVSYEDKSVKQFVAYEAEKVSGSYANNYQYDGTAAPMSMTVSSSDLCANVFQAKAAGGKNEELKAVGVQTYDLGVSYTVQIYTGLTNSANPTSGTLAHTQSGTLKEAGYQQIKLNKAVTLKAGSKYSVVISLKSNASSEVAIGADTSADANWIVFQSNVGSGQSFVKIAGVWYDVGAELDGNFRIKAYTNNTNVTTQDVKYSLDKSLGVSKGSSATLKLKADSKTISNKNAKWSSSNKKVATVGSTSGKVKGKAYGTATISAKVKVGNTTKTLKCKVTVGPSKLKSLKITCKKKKITVSWKRNTKASGYEIYYSKSKTSSYKKLKAISSGKTTKYSKTLKKGTYYVKVRPYMKKSGKKLYGSYTSPKKVKVK